MSWVDKVALFTAVVLPFWNIPLILRMIRRRSSADISLWWALGVWGCLWLMAPSGFRSEDIVWRVFNISNLILFTCVAATVLYYRLRGRKHE